MKFIADNTSVKTRIKYLNIDKHPDGCNENKKSEENKPSGRSRTTTNIDMIKVSLVFLIAFINFELEIHVVVVILFFRARENLSQKMTAQLQTNRVRILR
jgi:hypothetical protein